MSSSSASRTATTTPPRRLSPARWHACGSSTGDDGRFDRSLLDTGGEALVVSQFTLIADTRRGHRPSFSEAARPEQAEPLYERFCSELRELGIRVETGVFGARMAVELVNDGPVTIVLP